MPRKLRLEYGGAIYHILNRGDRREAIFKDDLDRQQFLSALEEACQKTQWQVHGSGDIATILSISSSFIQ